jgi:HNH endonuclease.
MATSVRESKNRNREQKLARRRAAGPENRRKWRGARQRWTERNRDRIREAARRRWERNKDRLRVKHRELLRQPKHRATAKRWIEQHAAAVRSIQRRANAKRKALERGAVVIERINYDAILRRDRMHCHICRRKVTLNDLHFDHVMPLARGGTHTADNIAVSHARCNLSKGARVLTLF